MAQKDYTNDINKLALSLKNTNNATEDYFYTEYSNLSLLALLAEEKRYLSHLNKDDDKLNQVISGITGLEVFFEVQKIDFSDIQKIAVSIEDKLILDRWKDNKFYSLDGGVKIISFRNYIKEQPTTIGLTKNWLTIRSIKLSWLFNFNNQHDTINLTTQITMNFYL